MSLDEVRRRLSAAADAVGSPSSALRLTQLLQATLDAAQQVVVLLESSTEPEDRPLLLLNGAGASSRALAERIQEMDDAGWRESGNGS